MWKTVQWIWGIYDTEKISGHLKAYFQYKHFNLSVKDSRGQIKQYNSNRKKLL